MLLTPTHFTDTDDWKLLQQLPPESRHRMLVGLFSDLLLKRPTELRALLNLYYAAEQDEAQITDRQFQALDLLTEAEAVGILPRHRIAYVARKMNVNPPAVYKLLQRASQSLQPRAPFPRQQEALRLRSEAARIGLPQEQWVRFIADEMGISIRAVNKHLTLASAHKSAVSEAVPERLIHTSVDEARIISYMMTHKRECAGAGRGESILILRDGKQRQVEACKGYTVGNKSLCWSCNLIWGTYGDHWPGWLVFRERDIRLSFRREAIEALRLDDDDLNDRPEYGDNGIDNGVDWGPPQSSLGRVSRANWRW